MPKASYISPDEVADAEAALVAAKSKAKSRADYQAHADKVAELRQAFREQEEKAGRRRPSAPTVEGSGEVTS